MTRARAQLAAAWPDGKELSSEQLCVPCGQNRPVPRPSLGRSLFVASFSTPATSEALATASAPRMPVSRRCSLCLRAPRGYKAPASPKVAYAEQNTDTVSHLLT